MISIQALPRLLAAFPGYRGMTETWDDASYRVEVSFVSRPSIVRLHQPLCSPIPSKAVARSHVLRSVMRDVLGAGLLQPEKAESIIAGFQRPETKTVVYIGHQSPGDRSVFRHEHGKTAVALPVRLDLANHSPTGFAWGYCGSGPAQLALAILADAAGDDMALQWYQQFKQEVIGHLAMDEDFRILHGWVLHWLDGSQYAA